MSFFIICLTFTAEKSQKGANDGSSPVTTKLEAREIPHQLAQTLETIVSQLDMLTQTVSILEERMTLVENHIAKSFDDQVSMLLRFDRLMKQVTVEVRRAGDEQ